MKTVSVRPQVLNALKLYQNVSESRTLNDAIVTLMEREAERNDEFENRWNEMRREFLKANTDKIRDALSDIGKLRRVGIIDRRSY